MHGLTTSGPRVVPQTVKAALRWVHQHHSHHEAPQGARFAVGVANGEHLCVVALVGSPTAPELGADPTIAEVTRVASDGSTKGAASEAIRAASRMALAGGYRRLVSYTLLGESGLSYRAAGWRITGLSEGGERSRPSRRRAPSAQSGPKVRWEYGPGGLPADGAAALVAGMCVGRIELRSRQRPLFAPEVLACCA